MKSDWYKDCKTDAERTERKELVRTSKLILGVINNILTKMIVEAQAEQAKKDNYTNAAWACQQADYIGTIRTLKQIQALLDQEETK